MSLFRYLLESSNLDVRMAAGDRQRDRVLESFLDVIRSDTIDSLPDRLESRPETAE